MSKRKIALFGGTFDPVHIGHISVAEDAARQIGVEKIVFVPAKRSPLKGFLPQAGDEHRLAMIAIAITEKENFEVSDFELNKPAPSYTLRTVKKFQADYGEDCAIYWLLGADSIDDLQYWRAIEELIDACNLCTMYRAGCNPPDYTEYEAIWGRSRVEKLQRNIIKTPLVDVSSTEIRGRLALGEDTTGMLQDAVADYIRCHNLYRPPGQPPAD